MAQDAIKPLAFDFHDKLVAVLADHKGTHAMLASMTSALDALKQAKPSLTRKTCSDCALKQGTRSYVGMFHLFRVLM